MEHKNICDFRLTAFVPGDTDGDNAWAAILTDASGEQILLSFSLEVAGKIFGQVHAALRQISREGKTVEVPSTPERVTGYNAVPFQSADGEMLVDILIEGDQSPRALHGVMERLQAKSFAALLQSAAESSGPKRAN